MPNWCSNDLFVYGPEREAILEFIAGSTKLNNGESRELLFDFAKVIPETHDGKGESWYNWRLQNWGTKWNASDTVITRHKRSVKITFETAWSPPIPILHALAEKFPNNTFCLRFYEMGMAFKGHLKLKGETVLEKSEGKYNGTRGG